MIYDSESDVFISGSGITGLYAAVLFSKIGLSVKIIDKKLKANHSSKVHNGMILFSPRSLQLLQHLDLSTQIIEKGTRHWKFNIIQNKGHGGNAVTVDQKSLRLWENEATEFNFSLSCEKSIVCKILEGYLEKQWGITVEYKQEVFDIKEPTDHASEFIPPHTTDLSSYYQYRPLPTPHQSPPTKKENERNTKTVHYRNVETADVQLWKTQSVIGADGPASFVRQKLGVSSKPIKSPLVFYTLEVYVLSTTFPGVRQISTVTKDNNVIFIIGSQEKMYFTFQHDSSWSKTSIDDEIHVSLALKHIRYIMEPFQIEFGKVRSYNRWNGDENSCEEKSVNASYFFIGSAAQNINPPGLFDINTHWEQIHNLGWKLALSLKHRASPRLLDTFEIESQFKTEEALNLSNAFIQLIKKQETESSNHLGYNASLVKELSYQLNRYRACFIGNSFFSNNILNYSPTLDIPDEDEGTGSFVFVGPDDKKSLAGPGCLAPNAKLKPYTFFHLLLNATSSANIKGPDEVKNAPIAEVQPPCTSTSAQNPPSPSSERRERSNSATSRQLIPAKWSVLPRIQKSKRSSNSKPSQLKRQSSTTDTILDRWKSIKPNHFQLHKAIQSSCQNHCTFTILVFCGSLTDPESFEKIQTFHKLLDSPTSFYHRYSDESFFKHATSSPLYIHHRASVSSLASLNNVQQHYKAGSTSSSHIPYRKSVSSDHRDSSSFEEDRRSSSDSSSTSASTSEKNQLFSLLFVSSSTKNEALQFLTTTHPSIVHTCFPDGLAKVFLDHDQQCYKAYDVKQNLEIVVIRPDGYIGTRVHEPDSFDQLCMYFDSFLRPPVDMYTAAAVVAAGYDC